MCSRARGGLGLGHRTCTQHKKSGPLGAYARAISNKAKGFGINNLLTMTCGGGFLLWGHLQTKMESAYGYMKQVLQKLFGVAQSTAEVQGLLDGTTMIADRGYQFLAWVQPYLFFVSQVAMS